MRMGTIGVYASLLNVTLSMEGERDMIGCAASVFVVIRLERLDEAQRRERERQGRLQLCCLLRPKSFISGA